MPTDKTKSLLTVPSQGTLCIGWTACPLQRDGRCRERSEEEKDGEAGNQPLWMSEEGTWPCLPVWAGAVLYLIHIQ